MDALLLLGTDGLLGGKALLEAGLAEGVEYEGVIEPGCVPGLTLGGKLKCLQTRARFTQRKI